MFQEAAALVAGQLREIGIDMDVKVLPDKELFDLLDRREMTLFLSRLGCTTGDMSDILQNALRTVDRTRRDGWHNYGEYSNPQIDRLIDASNEIPQVERRKVALQRIMSLLMDDLVWIPLYIDQDVYAVRSSLAWTPRSDSFVIASEIRRK